MIAGILLLNQVLQEEKQPLGKRWSLEESKKIQEQYKEKTNNDNNIIDNAYFTEIRDIKGNLKGVKYVKSRSRGKISRAFNSKN